MTTVTRVTGGRGFGVGVTAESDAGVDVLSAAVRRAGARLADSGDGSAEVAAERLSGAGFLTAVFLTPRSPGGVQCAHLDALPRLDVAAIPHERTDRGGQVFHLRHQLRPARRLGEPAAFS
jgi:hypothetical protein